MIGKGKNSNTRTGSNSASDHISRPLATLKDPTAFGPPPKNVNFHGGAALPNQITPDRRGLGAPLTSQVVEAAERAVHEREEAQNVEQEKPAGPPVPYRANRTGLNTDHLLPPPIRRATEGDSEGPQVIDIAQKPPLSKPFLPPRLPPRSNSATIISSIASGPPPPTYDSVVEEPKPAPKNYINQEEATNRLGRAGISVPGLGIGQTEKTSTAEQATSSPSTVLKIDEVQSRFSRKNTAATPTQSPPPPGADGASQGTTLAQKQAAFKTAQSFNKDPSSVSAADAHTAALTANNFRERHQDQISAGAQKARSWDKKYNITSRMNSFLAQQDDTQQSASQPAAQGPNPSPMSNQPASIPDLGNRKPPPPPPPKKPSAMLGHVVMGAQAPPPVPLGTKPSFA